MQYRDCERTHIQKLKYYMNVSKCHVELMTKCYVYWKKCYIQKWDYYMNGR